MSEVLHALVYFCDTICASHCIVHLVFGVFFGFILGHAQPAYAFWSASGIGFVKEVIDYFKHHAESASFNYLTDAKYGIVDGFGDWAFWAIGGAVVYFLLRRSHRAAQKSVLSQNLGDVVKNLSKQEAALATLVVAPALQRIPVSSEKNLSA